MNEETKYKLIQAGVMLLVIGVEWYSMQAYHDPLRAKMLLTWSKICQRIAYAFGSAGLRAEAEYYRSLV